MKEKYNKVIKFLSKFGATVMCCLLGLQMKVLAAPSSGGGGGGKSVINTAQVETTANNIKNAAMAAAFPLGSVLILIGVISVSIRIAVHHNNPNERSKALGGLGWLALSALLLGSALLIAGLFIQLGTNGSGTMMTN